LSLRLFENIRLTKVSAMQMFQLIRYSTLILIGIAFSKSAIHTSEIGQYETVMFLAGAVSFFWLNGIIQGILPSLGKESTSIKSPGLFNVFCLLSAFSLLTALFLVVFEHSVSTIFLKGSSIPFLWYLIAYVLFSSPAGLAEYVFLIRGKNKEMLVYGVVSYFLMFILVVVPAVAGWGMERSLCGLVVSSFVRFLWILVLLFKYSFPHFDFAFIARHLKCSTPLVFSMLLSGSGQYIDGFIISGYFDDATFAVFRFGAREFPLALLLANAFNTSMLPSFSDTSRIGYNLELIRKNTEKLAKGLFLLSGLLMLLSHWAFPVLFNTGFKDSATIFNIYLLLIISRLLFPQTILIGLQKNQAILWASLGEIIVNVVFSLWFLHLWGLFGVAYGTLLAYLFEKLILMAFVKKKCGYSVSSYLNIRQHLFYSLLLSAEFVVIEFLIR
jgi:O-antigen/teichoic acid export membrane protein